MRCASTGATILWLLRGCKIPGSVWPANTKPALRMIWWPHFLQWGSRPPFLHPAPDPQKNLNFDCREHPQTPSFEVPCHGAPAASPSSMCGVENTTFYPLLHTSNIHKITLSKPVLSPNDATSQRVSHLQVSSARSRVCSSSHPSQEKLHTLKTPSRARLRSLNLLHKELPPFCVATPLVKWNLEQFMVAECP